MRTLEAELGVAPDDATTALYDAIRFRRFPPQVDGQAARGQAAATALPRLGTQQATVSTAMLSTEAGNDDTQARADEPAQPPFVVPVPPTPMVNRVADVQTIGAQLCDQPIRALTITGIGGIGKTRLALEAAHALRDDFRDGIYFVELAALKDAALVADGIAQVLGVKERPGQPMSTTLRDQLGSKHLLLILDNFEHVITAASLVSDLLAACPSLRVLVTSRAALNIRAEHQLRLEPLTDADAVQLFVQRAYAAGAVLTTNDAGIAVYSAICQRLDRLPLAIELIAVRARTLAPLDLLRLLDQPLQALVRGPRDVPARHQTLCAAIQWSYDLLDAEAQRVFMRLGVFAGGFSVEAAQAVLGESLPVLPVLETLHEVSLLQQQIVADETRFLMLATIREFALGQLTAHGEATATHDRHMAYYARFALAADVELLRAEAPRWQARVTAEQDNLRTAFRWSMDQQEYATALRIATGVWRFHWIAGRLHEGIERLELALAHREQAPLDVQAHALRAAGTLAGGVNDFTRARQWLEAAVDLSRRRGDLLTLQPALTNLGYALVEQGELATAQPYLAESIVLARQASDPSVVKFPLGILAGLYQRQSKYAQAQAAAEECLQINQARRDPEGTANALRTLATIIHAQGDALRAQALGQAALDLHCSLNHQLGIGLDYLVLGDISRAQDDHAGALTHYQHCLDLWKDGEHKVHSAPVFDRIAQIFSAHDDPVLGTKLMATAQTIREQTNTRLVAAEHVSRDNALLACRVALGEAAFAAAWADGCALTLAQAISLAMARRGPAAIKPSTRERPRRQMQPFVSSVPARLAERPHGLDGDVIVITP
ncbi:MAG: AAA family ATPase [Chloroflexi bacterium]|nr:AAA family ATPase [Chloroflexota bacterium]